MYDLAILGGGITGLAAAHYAHRADRELRLTVIEAASRFGGKVLSERRRGFLLEGGPDAVLTRRPEPLELARELGLGDRIEPSRDEHRGLYLLRRGELVRLPGGGLSPFAGAFASLRRSSLLSPGGRLRLTLEPWVPARRRADDESLGAFLRRRLGREAGALVAPLLAHLHMADPERLSVAATYPALAALERRHGSLTRGGGAAARPATEESLFWTLRDGMAELTDALARRLTPEERRLGTKAIDLQPLAGRPGFRLALDDGTALEAAAVVLALPADAAATVVRRRYPQLAAGLAEIPYVSLATLSLGYRAEDVARRLDGFGFFTAPGERRRVVAATWASTKFPGRSPAAHVLLRAFLGGAGREAQLELDDDALAAAVEAELKPAMGLRGKPLLTRLVRWQRGYPQYEVGHPERLRRLTAGCPAALLLAGSAYHGVGLPDCLRSARDAAERAVRQLHAAPALAPLLG